MCSSDLRSREERDELVRTLVRTDLDASVRIWLVAVQSGYPATDALADLTLDVRSGPRNSIGLRTARIPGRTDLNVGVPAVWNESSTWNPVGGSGDVFSTNLLRLVTDPGILYDPWSGLATPYRTSYEVRTAGPDGTLPVPGDAVLWDAAADAWVPVAAGTTATSVVTYDLSKYIGAPWHDGQPIGMEDLLYAVAQTTEIVDDPVKAQIEPTVATKRKATLATYKGYRLLDDHRIEVYADFWHFDPNEIAWYANPYGFSWPWEISAALDELVFTRRAAAYTRTTAASANLPWISLVLGRDAAMVDGVLAEMEAAGTVPAGVFEVAGRTFVTPEQARARYAAARAYFASHGHLVDTSGAYDLARFDTSGQYAELRAIRDPRYPMTPDALRRDGVPTIAIGKPSTEPIVMGTDATLAIPVTVTGTPSLAWLLIDPATRLPIAQGAGTPGTDPGTLLVTIPADVTGNAFPGPYQLYVAATSDAVALVGERRIDVEIVP